MPPCLAPARQLARTPRHDAFLPHKQAGGAAASLLFFLWQTHRDQGSEAAAPIHQPLSPGRRNGSEKEKLRALVGTIEIPQYLMMEGIDGQHINIMGSDASRLVTSNRMEAHLFH
jgi:hypothetical protein